MWTWDSTAINFADTDWDFSGWQAPIEPVVSSARVSIVVLDAAIRAELANTTSTVTI